MINPRQRAPHFFLLGFITLVFSLFPSLSFAEFPPRSNARITAQPTAQPSYAPYNWRFPYYEAVPSFLDAALDAFQGVENKEEIYQWAQKTGARMPEFIDDMIAVCATIEQDPFAFNDIELIQQFDQKWLDIFATCPGCEEAVFPLLKPLVDEAIKDFPPLPIPPPDELATQSMARYFQFFSDVNPWRLGAFFDFVSLPKIQRTIKIHEEAVETQTLGVKNTYVKYRKTMVIENIQVKFMEVINNDQVSQVSGDQGPPTLIHEVTQKLWEQGGNPDLVKALQDLTAYVDEQLQAAWESGAMDDFSYHYLYDQRPMQNELVYVSHPLFLHPDVHDPRKVQEFYRRNYATEFYKSQGWPEYNMSPAAYAIASVQNLGGSSVPSKFMAPLPGALVSNKQKIFSAPELSANVGAPPISALPVGGAIPMASDAYLTSLQRFANFFTSGMFLPFYLFGVLGINKFLSL